MRMGDRITDRTPQERKLQQKAMRRQKLQQELRHRREQDQAAARKREDELRPQGLEDSYARVSFVQQNESLSARAESPDGANGSQQHHHHHQASSFDSSEDTPRSEVSLHTAAQLGKKAREG